MTPSASTLIRVAPPPVSRGNIELARVAGRTAVVGLRADSPLRLLCPRQTADAAWVVAGSYGGGLVRGDRIEIDLTAGPNTRTVLGTQATTKVYGVGRPRISPIDPITDVRRLGCSQTLRCRVDADAILISWPDPVTCFAGAKYDQSQRFELADGASIVSVDWLTSGRMARGEVWSFERYRSLTTVHTSGKLLLHDAMLLDTADGCISTVSRSAGFACIGTAWLIGPKVKDAVAALFERLARVPIDPRRDVQFSISPLATGAVVRFAGRTTEAATRWLSEQLAEVVELIGFDPYARRG